MNRDTPKYIVQVAKELRRNQTESEKILWEELRGNRLSGKKFRRQYAIGRYIADFYCCEARICIEIDGEIHNSSLRKEYDQIRQEEIEARNIKVLRFKNAEIHSNIKGVLDRISDALAPLPVCGEGKKYL
jgi:very-short-patch-repair endonuclease